MDSDHESRGDCQISNPLFDILVEFLGPAARGNGVGNRHGKKGVRLKACRIGVRQSGVLLAQSPTVSNGGGPLKMPKGLFRIMAPLA